MSNPSTNVKTLNDAKGQFVELWGAPLILSRWLAWGLAAAVVVIIADRVTISRLGAQLAQVKPIVVRIDGVGRAEAVDYDTATWKPQIPELRYFLTRFVVLHYGRLRATIARDYPASLFFLDGVLSNALLGAGATSPVEVFVQQPGADEVDIEVLNVTFSNLSTPPYRASVDFVRHRYPAGFRSGQPKSEQATAQLDFTWRDTVPNAFVPVNPLGLQITQIRVDEAF